MFDVVMTVLLAATAAMTIGSISWIAFRLRTLPPEILQLRIFERRKVFPRVLAAFALGDLFGIASTIPAGLDLVLEQEWILVLIAPAVALTWYGLFQAISIFRVPKPTSLRGFEESR